MVNQGSKDVISSNLSHRELSDNLSELNKLMSDAPSAFKGTSKALSDISRALSERGSAKGADEESIARDEAFTKNAYKVLKDAQKDIKRMSRGSQSKGEREDASKSVMALTNAAASLRTWNEKGTSAPLQRVTVGEASVNKEATRISRKNSKRISDVAKISEKTLNRASKTENLRVSQDMDTTPSGTLREKGKDNTGAKSLMNVLRSSADGFSSFNSAIGDFTKSIGSAYSTMANSMGDILDYPFESMAGVMNGMAGMITSSFSTISSILDTASDFISSIFDVAGTAGKGEGGTLSSIGGVLNSIIGIFTSLINMAIQAIQAGFEMFTSTLMSVLKITKKIALSSPIMKAILDILNLALTLFFIPFMNSFALVLLPYVLDLLNWAVTTGNTFSSLGETLGLSLVDMLTGEENILERVGGIASSFLTDFLPLFLELVPDLIDFAVDFVTEILDNAPLIIKFMQAGFGAFSAMIDSGMLSTFLGFGVDVMRWLGANAPELVTFIIAVMSGLLSIASFFMKFVPSSGSSKSNAIDDSFKSSAEALSKSMEDPVLSTESAIDSFQNSYSAYTGDTAINGGIPMLDPSNSSGEYALSESELNEIGKDTTITIQYHGDVLSNQEFQTGVAKILNDQSAKATYR